MWIFSWSTFMILDLFCSSQMTFWSVFLSGHHRERETERGPKKHGGKPSRRTLRSIRDRGLSLETAPRSAAEKTRWKSLVVLSCARRHRKDWLINWHVQWIMWLQTYRLSVFQKGTAMHVLEPLLPARWLLGLLLHCYQQSPHSVWDLPPADWTKSPTLFISLSASGRNKFENNNNSFLEY